MELQKATATRTLSKEQAMAAIEELESILGPSESVRVFLEIEEDYLGNEFDILYALMARSDLVERALASILKDTGRAIFQAALVHALGGKTLRGNGNCSSD
jgi:hypothetical protein